MGSNVRAPTDDLLEIQLICSIYVGQLLVGCEDSKCVGSLCRTGRKNTGTVPDRGFTPRSARAIAFAVASTPTPRKHLCRYYYAKITTMALPTEHVGPRDPSAFIQQISDTTTIQELCNHELLAPDRLCQKFMVQYNKQRSENDELRGLHVRLNDAKEWPFLGSNGQPNAKFQDNSSMFELAKDCLLWLHTNMPRASRAVWERIDYHISTGETRSFSTGPHELDYKMYLALVDVLESSHMLNILTRLCALVSFRIKLDLRVGNEAYQLAPNHTFRGLLRTYISSWSPDFWDDYRGNGLISMLKKIFLREWDGACRLQRMKAACGALELLELLHEVDPRLRDSSASVIYYLPSATNRLVVADTAQDWMEGDNWPALQRHMLTFRPIFSPGFMAFYFKMTNHLKMRSAHTESDVATDLGRRTIIDRPLPLHKAAFERHMYLITHYLLLHVSRSNVLQDAFDQLWHRRRAELFRPLRVRLGEVDQLEVGHDLGGVQIEFFNLICREIFAEGKQLFVTDATTGLSYFQPCSLQPLHYFELIGILMSLAVYNGITLPISMPIAFYRKLLGRPCDRLEHIKDGWPTVCRSLQSLLQLEDEVDGLEYTFPLEANGLRLSVVKSELSVSADGDAQPHSYGEHDMMVADLSEEECNTGAISRPKAPGEVIRTWPGWTLKASPGTPILIDQENKQAYVEEYIDWLTTSSIRPQWNAFHRGFNTCLCRRGLSLLTPRSLQLVMEGKQHIDLAALRRATKYDGYDPQSKSIQWFWSIMEAWSEERQRQLLKFVTAIERMPLNGIITFCIKRAVGIDTEALPTSSTCFGTLNLPRYDSLETLESKLNVAIEYGLEGFGSG